MIFIQEVEKENLSGDLISCPYENYSRRFPEGVQNRKSNYDDKHDHCQEKRRLSTLCGGKYTLHVCAARLSFGIRINTNIL